MLRNQHNENCSAARVKRGRAVVIGYGLDDCGGHFRYTKSNGTELFGGSDRAHCEMQRRAARIQEEIDELGICLDQMTFEQFQQVREIVERVGGE